MKEPLCFSCRFADIKVVDVITKGMFPKHKQQLNVWCKKHFNNKMKFCLKCDDYRPKAGKINKKLYQKTLFDIKEHINEY